jgi:hypothetical protein
LNFRYCFSVLFFSVTNIIAFTVMQCNVSPLITYQCSVSMLFFGLPIMILIKFSLFILSPKTAYSIPIPNHSKYHFFITLLCRMICNCFQYYCCRCSACICRCKIQCYALECPTYDALWQIQLALIYFFLVWVFVAHLP